MKGLVDSLLEHGEGLKRAQELARSGSDVRTHLHLAMQNEANLQYTRQIVEGHHELGESILNLVEQLRRYR